jgi:hypothetical protein
MPNIVCSDPVLLTARPLQRRIRRTTEPRESRPPGWMCSAPLRPPARRRRFGLPTGIFASICKTPDDKFCVEVTDTCPSPIVTVIGSVTLAQPCHIERYHIANLSRIGGGIE